MLARSDRICRRTLTCVLAIFALSTSISFVSQAQTKRPKALRVEEAPREVNAAISLSSWLDENQLRTQLHGHTSGYLDISLQLETKGGFKLYEDKLSFWTEAEPELGNEEWKVTVINKPPTHLFLDPVTKTMKSGFKGQSLFKLRLSLPDAGVSKPLPLSHKVPLVVGFQVCSDNVCLFPTALKMDFDLTNQAKVAATLGDKSISQRASDSLKSHLSQGSIFGITSMLLLVLAGILTAFTPCVYPIYPITLGMFSRWAHSHKVKSPFGLVLIYCAGMVLSYAVVGLVTAASGAVFGALTQTPFFLIGVGILILASALVFSGLIDLKFFSWLQHTFGGASDDSAAPSGRAKLFHSGLWHYMKSFSMGAVLGLVAAPCVGPVLVVILAWLSTSLASGSSQAYLTGFVLLALFGIGMSLPFLVLGHLMIRMGSRPSLGKYTPIIKTVGTILMLFASGFFLIPGAKMLWQSHAEIPRQRYPVYTLQTLPKDKVSVIDFRADWCAACIELEHETFADPSISKLFEDKQFQLARVDLTNQNDETEAIVKRYGIVGLPTVLITNAQGEICLNLSLNGFESAKDFKKRLEGSAQCQTK